MTKSENEIGKKRWTILFTIVLAAFMSNLDGSIVNVALPDISVKLHASMASVELVVTSFLITVAATILIFGKLGDVKGKTKIFKIGVVIFSLGSLFCGITNSLLILVISRIIQAIGAAAEMANSQGIITEVFPAEERGRALGFLGTSVALGAMAGPPLGGVIISVLNWNYIFLINVVIGVIVFLLSIKVLPKNNKAVNGKLDGKGAVLFAIAIVSLFGSIVEGQIIGYFNLLIIAAFIVALLAFITFIIIENRTNSPLLYLKIFSNSLFSISIICGFISFTAISASNIILPFFFQDALKFSAETTGFLLMISPIILAVVAPFSGYLSDKIGSEILTIVGLALTSVGLFLMGSLNEKSLISIILAYIFIMTIGNGIFQSPNNSLIMSSVPRDKLGIAGSVNALVRDLGFVVGTSFSTLILYNRMSYKIGYRVIDYVKGRDDVFTYGMDSVYICGGILCAVGVVITAIRFLNSKKKNCIAR